MIQVYHSIFAELIRDFIAYKRAAGYKYETEAVYLKTFDDLCFSLNIDDYSGKIAHALKRVQRMRAAV